MSLRKKKGSEYWYCRFRVLGKAVEESTKTMSKVDAKRYEEKRRREVLEERMGTIKYSKTWKECEERWLVEMKHKRTLSQDISYFRYLDKYFDEMRVSDISRELIESIAKNKELTGISGSSVNKLLELIKAVLNKACKQWGWLEKVPFIFMRKKSPARIRYLTIDEACLLISNLPDHLKHLVRFSLSTGLRAKNVLELKWADVDLSTCRLLIKAENFKTNKNTGIPLNKEAVRVLYSCIGGHSLYVFTYKNKPIKQCNTKAWKKALIRSGISDFRWHDLRHTWASWHIQNGTSIAELQQLGGWASFEMVLRYAHLCPDNLRTAAERLEGINL